MKEIQLTKNQTTIVDDEDYDFLSQWKWFAVFMPPSNRPYACRNEWDFENKRRIRKFMHRELLGLSKEDKRVGDHINLDTLDNRGSNLRAATRSQNMANMGLRKDNTSGLKGVVRRSGNYDKPWIAQIGIGLLPKNLGVFATKEEAYEAYRKAAISAFGEFARVS
jgi:hypothetical protein